MASLDTTKFALHDTEKGVRIDIQLYYYPDSHANFLDSAGENFPVADDNEVHWNFALILDQAKKHMRARKLKVG